ncbi:hypothetical protein Rin_00002810 [Candidatus Regiella insecticola 5.15]|uniref:Uncharacterized protein n=1 Tax=Candidatus Regiella insecticola 5.15 TaxID=1005043 RepID=G2GWZ4_9ENTR|nr:hypothetical protein Rin_00002810 [Candidatus Regiella insecticola 5.15]
MLRFSGVINNYNYSWPIRIVLHGGVSWRPPGFQLPATYPFCPKINNKNCFEKFIDKNNLVHRAYTNITNIIILHLFILILHNNRRTIPCTPIT